MDLHIFQRLCCKLRCFGLVGGQRLGDDRDLIKAVHAPDGEGQHDGIDFAVNRERINKKVLSSGIELLVVRKNIIDLVSSYCFLIAAEVSGDLDIFGGESGLFALIELILLKFGETVIHFGSIQVLRVVFTAPRVEVVQV